MQNEKPGKIPRGGGGGVWQAPPGMENPGMGSKGYEYFLELHNNLSYFWFLSTKIIKKKCIFSNFHEPDLRLISMCLAFFAKFCWINERPSTFYCCRFKISRLNMKTHTCLFFLHPYLHVLLTPPPYFLVLLIIPPFQMDSLNLQLMVYL